MVQPSGNELAHTSYVLGGPQACTVDSVRTVGGFKGQTTLICLIYISFFSYSTDVTKIIKVKIQMKCIAPNTKEASDKPIVHCEYE